MNEQTKQDEAPRLIETPEEIEYELRATEGSLWTGTRVLVGAVAFAFASLAFAYFYLRSANSEALWRPGGVTAPIALGSAIFAVSVGAAGLMAFGNQRRRQGLYADWQVAGWTTVVLGLLVVSLQIWELTRLRFYPGSSGYASCFIAWAAMNIGLMLGATYWVETLLARSLRLRQAMLRERPSHEGLPADRIFHANAEGCVLFWAFTALVSTLFWVLFYII